MGDTPRIPGGNPKESRGNLHKNSGVIPGKTQGESEKKPEETPEWKEQRLILYQREMSYKEHGNHRAP
jgi:hypothetical protein